MSIVIFRLVAIAVLLAQSVIWLHSAKPRIETGIDIPAMFIFEQHAPWPEARFEASLNQDGTWTVSGDIEIALKSPYLDYGSRCVLENLATKGVTINPNPAHDSRITTQRATEIMARDPAVGPCLVYLHAPAEGREL